MPSREQLAEGDSDLLFLEEDDFDEALLGTVRRCGLTVACYDYALCVEVLTKRGMAYEEAVEYLEFNVLGAYVGERTPMFLERQED